MTLVFCRKLFGATCLTALLSSPMQALTLYSNDFTSGDLSGWSGTRLTYSPNGQRHMGQYTASEDTALSLPSHTAGTGTLTLSFDFYAIDSWDGNGNNDGLRVWTPTGNLLDATFSNFAFQTQSYPASRGGGSYTRGTGATAYNTLGYISHRHGAGDTFDDVTYHFELSRPVQNGDSLYFLFDGQLDQSIGDESWGLDNVVVSFTAAPEAGGGPFLLLALLAQLSLGRRRIRR